MSGVSIATGVIATDALGGGAGRGLQSPGSLGVSGVGVPVTGTTNETTLATIGIPASAMGINGYTRIWTLWTATNSANNKTIRVRLGGSVVFSSVVTTTPNGSTVVEIWNRGALNSQISNNSSTGAGLGFTGNAWTTTAIDMSVAQNITITGQLANSGETITLEAYTVELINP